MPTIEDTILQRAARFSTDPVLQPAFDAISRALDTHTKIRAKALDVSKDTHRTALGKRDVMQKYVGENAHELVRARKAGDTLRAKIAERRAKLLPAAPDPSNVASAMLRSEIRQMLRGMKNHGDRLKALLATDADTTFLEAVLEAPNAMSGITDDQRELIQTSAMERLHPGALAAIEAAEEAIELVDVAARVVFETARDAGEFPTNSVFSTFVETTVGATGQLEADLNRKFEVVANAA